MTLTAGLQMTGLAMLAVLLVVLVRLQRIGKARHGKVAQIHHGYLGAALMLVPWWPAQLVGLVILADDLVQHLMQLRKPDWLSPLHRLAHKVGVI